MFVDTKSPEKGQSVLSGAPLRLSVPGQCVYAKTTRGCGEPQALRAMLTERNCYTHNMCCSSCCSGTQLSVTWHTSVNL